MKVKQGKLLNKVKQYGSVVLLYLILSVRILPGQNILITGEESVLVNDPKKTRLEYEQEALMLARERALDKEFGTSVESNYEKLTQTEIQGRSVFSNKEIRSNYVSTYPNGRWIKDLNKSCQEEKDMDGRWWLKATVTGYASKIKSTPVRFIARTLDGPDPKLNQDESFIDGEPGYLYFRCPEDGFIIVFFDDFEKVQRCVPYNVTAENYLKVEANKEYIFFSGGEHDYMSDRSKVDSIEFFSNGPRDYNLFYILFSPAPFVGYFYYPPEKLENDYNTFKWMDREYFHNWLQEQRIRNEDLQLQKLAVKITKAQ